MYQLIVLVQIFVVINKFRFFDPKFNCIEYFDKLILNWYKFSIYVILKVLVNLLIHENL